MGAIPHFLPRRCAQSRRGVEHIQTLAPKFSMVILNRQAALQSHMSRSGWNGFRPVLRRRPVHPQNGARSKRSIGERTCSKRVSVPTAQIKQDDTSILLTPAVVPVAKITLGRHTRSRIEVTATRHGQQSISPIL